MFRPGETVRVQAVVASVDPRRGTVKVSIGHGTTKQIVTVHERALQRELPKALVEAASWAVDLSDNKGRH